GADNNASATITNPQNACAAIGSTFAAPVTYAQRNALSAAISAAGVGDVFINAQDMTTENVWVINKGVNAVLAPFWNTGEPNNSAGIEHCAEAINNGLWNDLDCAATRPVACANTDLTSWQILNTATTFSTTETLHQQCQQAFGLTWHFA